MKLLTEHQQKSYLKKCKSCYICKEKFEDKNADDKKYRKVRDQCYYKGDYGGAAHSICNLKNRVPKEISIVSHNGSNYDYHVIIKELAEEFEGQQFWRKYRKYITFTVPIEKEVIRIDKKAQEITITISYRLQFIDSARLVASSFSYFVNNLAE